MVLQAPARGLARILGSAIHRCSEFLHKCRRNDVSESPRATHPSHSSTSLPRSCNRTACIVSAPGSGLHMHMDWPRFASRMRFVAPHPRGKSLPRNTHGDLRETATRERLIMPGPNATDGANSAQWLLRLAPSGHQLTQAPRGDWAQRHQLPSHPLTAEPKSPFHQRIQICVNTADVFLSFSC